MEDKQTQLKTHRVQLTSRKNAEITGVKDVRSFDEQEIVLETELGILMISGTDLHVGRLTLEKGEIDITGRINSMVYTELKGKTKSGESVLARLFH